MQGKVAGMGGHLDGHSRPTHLTSAFSSSLICPPIQGRSFLQGLSETLQPEALHDAGPPDEGTVEVCFTHPPKSKL